LVTIQVLTLCLVPLNIYPAQLTQQTTKLVPKHDRLTQIADNISQALTTSL